MQDSNISPYVGGVINPILEQPAPINDIQVPIQTTLPTAEIQTTPGNISTSGYKQEATTEDILDLFKTKQKQIISQTPDVNLTEKIQPYNVSYLGRNFDRYYRHNKFSKLGFSPFRDNEALYNKYSTNWDEWSRMAGQWFGLAAIGFNANFKSYFTDIDESDRESAEDMEKRISIATSSKTGVVPWLTNLGAQTAYTAGMIGAVVVEELALTAATAMTAGALAPVQEASLASKVRLIPSLMETWRRGRSALNALNNLETSRSFWKLVKNGNIPEAIGKVITPNFVQHINAVRRLDKTTDVAIDIAKVAGGVGAFMRDIREINLALSESKLEGGFVQNEVERTLIDNYIKETGQYPDIDKLREIQQKAYEAGASTIYANIPILWLSNKVMFETMLKGFRPIRSLYSEVNFGPAGKIVFDEAAAKAGKDAVKVVNKTFGDKIKTLFKPSQWSFKPTMRGLINYTAANFTEGTQEVYQEAVSEGMKNYYINKYYDPNNIAYNSMMGSVYNALAKQMSEGTSLDVFASGFLMALPIKGVQNITFKHGPNLYSRIFDPKGYKEYKEQMTKNMTNFVNAANEFIKQPYTHLEEMQLAFKAQKDLYTDIVRSKAENNPREFHNAKSEIVFKNLNTLLKSGQFDTVMEFVKGFNEFTDTELEQAFNIPGEKKFEGKYLRKKLNEFIESAYDFKNVWEEKNVYYANPYNPNRFNKIKDKEKYEEELHKWRIYEHAKDIAIFSGYIMEDTKKRLNEIQGKLSQKSLANNISYSDISILLSEFSLDTLADAHAEISVLKQELEGLENIQNKTEQIKKDIESKKQKLEALSELVPLLDEFKIRQNEKFEKTYKIKGKEEKELTEEEIEYEEKFQEEFYKAFNKYIQTLGKNQVKQDDIDELFEYIRDFYSLGIEREKYTSLYNTLQNPEGYGKVLERLSKAFDQIKENEEILLKQALEKFIKDYVPTNAALNKLAEAGMVISPNDVDSLNNKEIDKLTFYDINTLEKITDENKIKQAKDILKSFFTEETEKTAEELYGEGWREVEENEVLPNGATVRINQETGKTYTNAPKRETKETKEEEGETKKESNAKEKLIQILDKKMENINNWIEAKNLIQELEMELGFDTELSMLGFNASYIDDYVIPKLREKLGLPINKDSVVEFEYIDEDNEVNILTGTILEVAGNSVKVKSGNNIYTISKSMIRSTSEQETPMVPVSENVIKEIETLNDVLSEEDKKIVSEINEELDLDDTTEADEAFKNCEI